MNCSCCAEGMAASIIQQGCLSVLCCAASRGITGMFREQWTQDYLENGWCRDTAEQSVPSVRQWQHSAGRAHWQVLLSWSPCTESTTMDRDPVSTQMQRLGFPKCKHVQSGHLSTCMICTLNHRDVCDVQKKPKTPPRYFCVVHKNTNLVEIFWEVTQ